MKSKDPLRADHLINAGKSAWDLDNQTQSTECYDFWCGKDMPLRGGVKFVRDDEGTYCSESFEEIRNHQDEKRSNYANNYGPESGNESGYSYEREYMRFKNKPLYKKAWISNIYY